MPPKTRSSRPELVLGLDNINRIGASSGVSRRREINSVNPINQLPHRKQLEGPSTTSRLLQDNLEPPNNNSIPPIVIKDKYFGLEPLEESIPEVSSLLEPSQDPIDSPLTTSPGRQEPPTPTKMENPPPPINPLVRPRGLPIVVPIGLGTANIPPNLPRFHGTKAEDPAHHVERYIEVLASCLVTDPGYYLVWFPTTLHDEAYEWYRNQPENIFETWDRLQRDFLDRFAPEVGQSAALRALAAVRQGREEDISSYIRRFDLVCARFVGGMLNDDTLRQFFIQGFSKSTTIRSILDRHPANLNLAKQAARDVEAIEREYERLWRKEDDSIPPFIPIKPKDENPGQLSLIPLSSQVIPANTRLEVAPMPLAVRPPPPPLANSSALEDAKMEAMKQELQQSQQGFKDDIMKQLQALTDQMVGLARNQNPNPSPPPIESGRHDSGLWCTACGQAGHTAQFCNAMASHNQQRYQAPFRVQNYQGSNYNQANFQNANQGANNQYRERFDVHAFCGKRHPPGQCWVESQVRCGNCGGNHPTDMCRKRDRVIPMQPPKGDYVQQAVDNQRGARNPPYDNTIRPPNMYYDYDNHRQNQHPPGAVQTSSGFHTLNAYQNAGQGPRGQPQGGQGSQDARFAGQSSCESIGSHASTSTVKIYPISPESNLITHTLVPSKSQQTTVLPTVAIMTRSKAAQLPPPLEEEETTTDSPLHLSELEEVAREAMKTTREKGKEPLVFDPTAEDMPFQNEPLHEEPIIEDRNTTWDGPGIPEEEQMQQPKHQVESLVKPYDVWADLQNIKANISIAQLLEISPVTRKLLKAGVPTTRRRRPKIKVAARIHTNDRPMDVRPIEIEVSMVDKILPKVLVDGGSGLNIMPLQTMEKLGLEITGPSPFVINMANQSPEAPLGQIKDCQVITGGESYLLTFHVIRMHSNKGSFPLLLGRPWLRLANAKVDWGGVKPHIIYGPPDNLTKVRIQPSIFNPTQDVVTSSEDKIPVTKKKIQKKVRFEVADSNVLAPGGEAKALPLTCLGPSFYDWEDDSQFTTWIAGHSTSDTELSSNFIEGVSIHELDDSYPNLAILVDEITEEDVCHLQMDGTQIEDLEEVLDEDQLCPPILVKKTSQGLQVGSELPIYPPVPTDWYRGPTQATHVQSQDWKLLDVSLEGEAPKNIKVGAQLTDEEVHEYKALVMEYRDVFAWSYKDLRGIPPEIALHTIPLIPGAKPVRQRERRMNPNLQLIVKAELERLLEAGFIRPVEITDWVSPMVLVKKKNGKLRVCIDYRTLNKCTQKDHFPLPFVNAILDEVAGHEMYTFMDGYSGYNQISIALNDQHKTAFTTPWGTFIYLVMPFGLCNAPAAFQRAMTRAFSDLLHRTMAAFIDDFSTQTTSIQHLAAVRESFERCRQARIALNPEKMYLAVTKGLLLGYIVSQKGNEPDSEKVDVIVNLKPPSDAKGVE